LYVRGNGNVVGFAWSYHDQFSLDRMTKPLRET
jgi:hypothetical protein